MSMAFGRFESTPYIRSRVFESLLAFQTQVIDSDTAYFSFRIIINKDRSISLKQFFL